MPQPYARVRKDSKLRHLDPGQQFPVTFAPDWDGRIWEDQHGHRFRHTDLTLTTGYGFAYEDVSTRDVTIKTKTFEAVCDLAEVSGLSVHEEIEKLLQSAMAGKF